MGTTAVKGNDRAAYDEPEKVQVCLKDCPQFLSLGVALAECVSCAWACQKEHEAGHAKWTHFETCHVACLDDIYHFDQDTKAKLQTSEEQLASLMEVAEDAHLDEQDESSKFWTRRRRRLW